MNNRFLLSILGLLIVVLAAILLLNNQTKTTVPDTNQQQKSPVITQKPVQTEKTIPNTTVTLTESGFSPQTITVKPGSRVTWLNKSGGMATVNSAEHPTHLLYPLLNLGPFDKDVSVQLIFEKKGTYKYHNHLSPTQTGTVVVE